LNIALITLKSFFLGTLNKIYVDNPLVQKSKFVFSWKIDLA